MIDLVHPVRHLAEPDDVGAQSAGQAARGAGGPVDQRAGPRAALVAGGTPGIEVLAVHVDQPRRARALVQVVDILGDDQQLARRSEEHTSELQSLMRISYAVICLKKKNKKKD